MTTGAVWGKGAFYHEVVGACVKCAHHFLFLLFTEYPGEIILLAAFIGYNETTLNMYLIITNCVESVC